MITALVKYGTEEWHSEPDRVRLAALKLARGDEKQLRYYLESAKRDYRDVVGPAEYPGDMKSRFQSKLTAEERDRISQSDSKQYQAWLWS